MSTTVFVRPAPLADITNMRMTQANTCEPAATPYNSRSVTSCESTALSPETWSPTVFTPHSPPAPISQPVTVVSIRQNNPWAFKCLPENDIHAALIIAQRNHLQTQRVAMRRMASATAVMPPVVPALPVEPATMMPPMQFTLPLQALTMPTMPMLPTPTAAPKSSKHAPANDDDDGVPPAPQEPVVCRTLVQFKCHQAEYSCHKMLEKGQYVVVQGDRGIDIGVVIRVNTDQVRSYIERTGPNGAVLRHATQREVDYWASELKADEATALEYCRQRLGRAGLAMEIRHAEYQFDKKKLTFYYDAKTRVNFVPLLTELFREFGCRIWMEKVRVHDI